MSPRGHIYPSSTVDYGWLVAFEKHQNFPCLKLIEIVILWVYYTIPFGFSLFWHFLVITFQLFILHVWLRITDEGSVLEMRIWSILLIYSDLKWCIHLSTSLYLNHNMCCIFYCCIRYCEYIYMQLLNQQIYINHPSIYITAVTSPYSWPELCI